MLWAIAPWVLMTPQVSLSRGSVYRTMCMSSVRQSRSAMWFSTNDFEARPAVVRETDLDQFRDLDAILTERAARFYASSSSSKSVREQCILVAIDKTLTKANDKGEDNFSTRESIEELCELCGTAGLSVAASCIQRLSLPNPKTFLNPGKLQELFQQCVDLDVRTIVIDDDLTPRQQRYIESSLNSQRKLTKPLVATVDGVEVDDRIRSADMPESLYLGADAAEEQSAIDKYFRKINQAKLKHQQNGGEQSMPAEEEPTLEIKVLDRTAIILDIFAQHAKSREGQLQVELAMLEYRSTRGPHTGQDVGTVSTAAGRGSQGAGFRGPGESKVELDKRDIKERIKMLKTEISSLELQRQTQRQSRHKLGIPLVALIGYTNAGKSTILNRLAKAGVLAEDMLFATLDPTTRKMRLPGRGASPSLDCGPEESRHGMELMLTDTVGFISKLPANIVAAFRATLESAADADVLIHVCDRSSPSWKKQRAVVMAEIDSIAKRRRRDHKSSDADVPIIELWNKIDLVDDVDQLMLEINTIPIEMEIVEQVQDVNAEQLSTMPTESGAGVIASELSLNAVDDSAVDEELTNFVCMPDDQYFKPNNQKKIVDPNNSIYQKNRSAASKKDKLSKAASKANDGHRHVFVPDSDGLVVTSSTDDISMASQDAAPSSSEFFRPRSQRVFVCAVSAKTGDGFDSFLDTLEMAVSSSYVRLQCFVPFSEDIGVTSTVFLKGVVEHVEYVSDGIHLICRVPEMLAQTLKRFEIKNDSARLSQS